MVPVSSGIMLVDVSDAMIKISTAFATHDLVGDALYIAQERFGGRSLRIVPW